MRILAHLLSLLVPRRPSTTDLVLENLALRHQLTVYQRLVKRPVSVMPAEPSGTPKPEQRPAPQTRHTPLVCLGVDSMEETGSHHLDDLDTLGRATPPGGSGRPGAQGVSSGPQYWH